MSKNEDKTKDRELLKIIKKDKRKFEIIYKKYYSLVLNYICKRINDKAIGEDLASEVFEKAYKAIEDFKWQGVSLSSWIFKIARNLLTDYYRRINKIGEGVSLSEIEDMFCDDDSSLYDDVIKGEEEKLLFDSLREFKDKDQYLIYYKFFEDLSNKEIAAITGQSESNIGTRLYRIRRKLKDILKRKLKNGL